MARVSFKEYETCLGHAQSFVLPEPSVACLSSCGHKEAVDLVGSLILNLLPLVCQAWLKMFRPGA